jgi:hypothetical protein
MNRKTFNLILGICLLSPGAMLAADAAKSEPENVTVVFDHPEQFSDVKDAFIPTEKGRDVILADIRKFIVDRANSFLKKGQKLEVKFTDIDLAGDFRPELGPSFNGIRILKDLYSPKMELEFRLTGADGKVLVEGKRKLTDQAYLQRLVPPNHDPLCYDKDLLSDWLRSDIKPACAPAH